MEISQKDFDRIMRILAETYAKSLLNEARILSLLKIFLDGDEEKILTLEKDMKEYFSSLMTLDKEYRIEDEIQYILKRVQKNGSDQSELDS